MRGLRTDLTLELKNKLGSDCHVIVQGLGKKISVEVPEKHWEKVADIIEIEFNYIITEIANAVLEDDTKLVEIQGVQ